MYIIGRGGFGKVWKVRLRKTNELFALKEMSKVKIIDRRSEISIMSEKNLLSTLHHPFIVNMHFAFQDFYNLYLVMDLLNGGDLRFHIAHKKTFSEDQTKFIISNIILALEYIHKKNIIHRDIKPENLVLESTGYVRITDFGVAKINEEDNSSETSGTPGYMAPEVILVQNHSFPSDFFALGVIGYEFMLGRRPYLGRGRKEIKQLIIAKQAKLNESDIPEGWGIQSMEFINSLLQRKPKKRLGYGGISEIKNHEWMKDIDWDLLERKKLEAPFIPPFNEQNYDKRYCEGVDNVGEETIERYELYLQSSLYGGVFQNYTYVNMYYINKFEKENNKKFRINSSSNGNKNKIILNNKKNSNKENNERATINNSNNNNSIFNDKNKEIKNYPKRALNSANIKNSSKSQKNINKNNNENIPSNIEMDIKSDYKTIDKSSSKKGKNYLSNIDKFSINNIKKYNTPMVNENIMCNNYINLNFNNCSNLGNGNIKNKKNPQDIDISTIKKIISNNINDLKQNMINNKNNQNLKNNLNYLKNRNEKNSINSSKKKGKISVNKASKNKFTLYKSSSMKSMGESNTNYFNGNKSPILVKSNNNKNNTINKNINKENNQKNIKLKKEAKSISINSTNLNSNDYNPNINRINSSKNQLKSNRINPLSASNFGIHKTANIDNHTLSRGKSEFNLKIDTNDMNFISLYHQRHKNKLGQKSFVKTASCDRIFMGSTTSHHNHGYHGKNKNSITNNYSYGKKTLRKERIKSTINFDKKLVSWIHQNFKNGKTKKLNFNNSKTNKNKNSLNKIKYTRHDSLLNINNSNYNLSNNNNMIKNKNFPCINSINFCNSPKKKIIELNSLNSNSRQIKSNRSNFNTINSMNSISKVQSMKNIYSNHKTSKFQRLLSQKTKFSRQKNSNSKIKKYDSGKGISKKMSAKNLFSDRVNYNINLNYKSKNIKIDSSLDGYELRNEKQNKANFEYMKSI